MRASTSATGPRAKGEATSTPRLFAVISGVYDEVRPSERKVADVVLKEPQATTRMSISALARVARVSEPTVLRFCRSLGYRGFIDFKLGLATDIAGGTPFVDQAVNRTDAAGTISGKLLAAAVRQMTLVHDTLDYGRFAEAAGAIEKARRIDLCGTAQAHFAAEDLQHRLIRLGFSAVLVQDPLLQLQAAAALQPGDLMIALSYAGQVRSGVEVLRQARAVGAGTIAITRSDAPLAACADVVLNVDTDEETFLYASTASRFAHLLVVDVLTTLLALRAGDGGIERLRLSRLSTRDYWIENNEGEARAERT